MTTSCLIVSLARCGSSAAYNRIKANAGEGCRGFFEPNSPDDWKSIQHQMDKASPVLVKAILRPYLLCGGDYDSWFDRVVALTRDPRDNLVSRLLFRMVSEKFVEQPDLLGPIVEMLRKKVSAPSSVSVVKLFRAMEATDLMEPFIDNRVEENLQLFSEWQTSCSKSFVFRYEDLVTRHFDELSRYLGFSLEGEATEPLNNPAIKRSSGMGEWRQWFTLEDIEFFRPGMDRFMERYGYSDDWELPTEPVIEGTTSIDYVRRYADLINA